MGYRRRLSRQIRLHQRAAARWLQWLLRYILRYIGLLRHRHTRLTQVPRYLQCTRESIHDLVAVGVKISGDESETTVNVEQGLSDHELGNIKHAPQHVRRSASSYARVHAFQHESKAFVMKLLLLAHRIVKIVYRDLVVDSRHNHFRIKWYNTCFLP